MKYFKVNNEGEIVDIAIDRKFISRSEAEEMFPNQPERSKREDPTFKVSDYPTRAWKERKLYNKGCGALNTTVTP